VAVPTIPAPMTMASYRDAFTNGLRETGSPLAS